MDEPQEVLKNKEVSLESKVLAVAETYEGPLPHPAILNQYDQVYPGASKLIFDEFQLNGKHIREVERLKTEGEIRSIKRGQYMAFGISLGLIAVIVYAMYLNLAWIAGLITVLSGIAAIASRIIKHK